MKASLREISTFSPPQIKIHKQYRILSMELYLNLKKALKKNLSAPLDLNKLTQQHPITMFLNLRL